MLAHLALVAATVLLSRADRNTEPVAETPARRVELISLPPLARSEPRPRPVEPAPRRVPRPQVRRGEKLPEEIATRPDPSPADLRLGDPPPASAPHPPEPPRAVASPEPTDLAAAAPIETEAQRLFGPRSSGFDHPSGPVVARRWATEVTDDRENDCTPRPMPLRLPGAAPEMGTVVGIVYREGTRQPLAGAFLQILGTPYSTFADERGAYSLSFDRALIDACRTQYVQVSKDGFAPRRLILSLGQRISNDIPMSRR